MTIDDARTYVQLYNEARSEERDFVKWEPKYYVRGDGCAVILNADRAKDILKSDYGFDVTATRH